MRILLFGGSGQLGHELRIRATDLSFELVSPVTKELDITEREQVIALTKRLKPDLVINCAAYTAVDKAEEDQERAFAINQHGALHVAEASREAGSRLIHISTDYVFDGSLGRALNESDPTSPLSVYGQSKLAGERHVLETLGQDGLVVRTSSLHGQKGQNFVHTMLKLMVEQPLVRVVGDQYMSPTWAGWLAETILDLGRSKCSGVLHASCSGGITWFDFAQEIWRLAAPTLEGREPARLERISASELKRPAKRPQYSVFDTARLASVVGRDPIPWNEGLMKHLTDIGVLER